MSKAIDPNLVEALKRRKKFMAQRGRKLKLRPPRMLEPRMQERAYRAIVKGRQRELTRLIEEKLLGRLAEILPPRRDAMVDLHLDGLADEMFYIINGVRIEFSRLFPTSKTRDEASRAANAVQAHNAKQLAKVLKSTLSVDLFRSEPWLKDQIDIFIEHNVGLIKTVEEKYFGDIQETVFRGARQGTSVKEIAEEIRERGQVSQSRAELIARDQINKFNGVLSEIRQRDLGVEKYIWRTSLDERVREEHRAREGKTFEWSNPPSDGNPGEAINCRCYAEPVLEDILGNFGDNGEDDSE